MKMPQGELLTAGQVAPAEKVDPAEHDRKRVEEADEDLEQLLHALVRFCLTARPVTLAHGLAYSCVFTRTKGPLRIHGITSAIPAGRQLNRGDALRGRRRVAAAVPEPADVGVELVARHEAGPDPAGDCSQLAVADQSADLVLGALELYRDLANAERRGPVHARTLAPAGPRD